MIQLGVTYSPTLMACLAAGPLDVDFIKVDADLGMDALQAALKYKPVMLHDVPDPFWLNYENPFRDDLMQRARALLDAAKSPWLSTGIGASAEPQGHRAGPYREADDHQRQTRERAVGNIIKHGKRLRDWAGVPLLLENYNYHPTNAYDYVCEPEVVHQILDAIGCGMLLDMSHARISAYNMGWSSTKDYFKALPLDKVREVHLSHPAIKNGQMLDMHQPAQPEDFAWLFWALDHTPAVEAVTLEVEELDGPTLLSQIDSLHKILAER
ncbi:MAG: DUF692 family protein [Anaerolineae bacterium]|nr:DUF692 family protein [Anaerolineae bacterium]